jgi:hypothetical protein
MHRRWLNRSSMHRTTPSWKIASRPSRRQRFGGTVLKPTSKRRCSDWSLTPVVKALHALRCLALVAVATLVAELGDITRFANPRRFMAYLGLVPSEHSRKDTPPGRDHQGGQWRGAASADRGGMELPVPGADRSRSPSASEKVEQAVRDMAWKVQERAFVCLVIAQTKPESSRAIAAVITVFSFPACPSFRYRRHSPL